MAMTIKGKVTFDFTYVLTSEEEAMHLEGMRNLTKRVAEGEKVEGLAVALVKAGLESGLEGAVRLNLKQGIQKLIKSELKDEGVRVGNVAVRV